jgi:hypothetical protein
MAQDSDQHWNFALAVLKILLPESQFITTVAVRKISCECRWIELA